MKEEIIKWIPILVVFIAGLFALIQIRSNNITNARLKWLDNLKLLIAEFFAESNNLMMKDGLSSAVFNKIQSEKNKSERDIATNEKLTFEIVEKLHAINLKHDLIKLNLNPKEELHLKFEKELDTYVSLFNKLPSLQKAERYQLMKKMGAQSDLLLLISRYMIKLDWEKTKRATLSYKYYTCVSGKKLLKEAMALKLEEN